MRTTPLIHVGYGDIVHAHFHYNSRSDKDKTIIVTEVRRRFGQESNGTYTAPLVFGTNTVTGEEETFDLSYVTKVIERYTGPQPKPRNIFIKKTLKGFFELKGGRYVGDLPSMVEYSLAKLNLPLDRPLKDDQYVYGLFYKQRPGLKSIGGVPGFPRGYVGGGPFEVDIKRFDKWVKRNVYSLIKSVNEMHRQRTRFNVRMDKIHLEDMEADMMLGDL